MVVPVLMTNCQVSEKPNKGPVTAQTSTTSAARMNVLACPAARDVRFATTPKSLATLLGSLRSSIGGSCGELSGTSVLIKQLNNQCRRALRSSNTNRNRQSIRPFGDLELFSSHAPYCNIWIDHDHN